jgi:hypothetical protein
MRVAAPCSGCTLLSMTALSCAILARVAADLAFRRAHARRHRRRSGMHLWAGWRAKMWPQPSSQIVSSGQSTRGRAPPARPLFQGSQSPGAFPRPGLHSWRILRLPQQQRMCATHVRRGVDTRHSLKAAPCVSHTDAGRGFYRPAPGAPSSLERVPAPLGAHNRLVQHVCSPAR